MKTCVDCGTVVADINAEKCTRCPGRSFTYSAVTSQAVSHEQMSSNESPTAVPTPSVSPDITLSMFINSLDSKTGVMNQSLSKLIELQNRSIEAQNRTTRAVRAFVRFLFIQLAAITLAFALFYLSEAGVNPVLCAANGESCEANSFLQLLGA